MSQNNDNRSFSLRYTMLSYTLNDGNTIPWIAFGTGTALYKQDASKAVTTAIDNGITHLDGAQMYDNEQSLGEGVKGYHPPSQ